MSKILSTQVTLTTTAVAYALGTDAVNEMVTIKALTTNTGVVYVGNDGDDTVSSSTGFPLAAGDMVILDAGYLGLIFATSTADGDKVAVLLGSV